MSAQRSLYNEAEKKQVHGVGDDENDDNELSPHWWWWLNFDCIYFHFIPYSIHIINICVSLIIYINKQ